MAHPATITHSDDPSPSLFSSRCAFPAAGIPLLAVLRNGTLLSDPAMRRALSGHVDKWEDPPGSDAAVRRDLTARIRPHPQHAAPHGRRVMQT